MAIYTSENQTAPEPLSVSFDTIPVQLQQYHQWVVWKYALVEDDIKKPPYDPHTGRLASVRNPATWGSFQDAKRTYETGDYAGVGFMLTTVAGIVGIDIDHCIEHGQLTEEASGIIATLDSYTERSPSGTGIRIFVKGTLPGVFRRRENVELYQDLRYLTITGQHIPNMPQEVASRQVALTHTYQRLFGHDCKPERFKENTGGGAHRPNGTTWLPRSDQEVLEKALQAKNGGNFRRYYDGDSSLWEGQGARHASQSEADFTLILLLLYWTNNDISQTERLFRQSGLMRQKWTRKVLGNETYGERLLRDAITKGRR